MQREQIRKENNETSTGEKKDITAKKGTRNQRTRTRTNRKETKETFG